MTRAGLIVNPQSGKSSGKGLALVDKLRARPGITVRVLERFEALPEFLTDMARDGVTDLFISSGDGTIQAIQTDLAERRPFAALPRLSLLPHGTTNMTAADLGFAHRSIEAQAAFIAALQPSDLRRRPTVRAVNPHDGHPRHGMFLGAGAVAEATLFCQKAFNANGVKGGWGVGLTLAQSVLRYLFTRPDPQDRTRFDRPFDIALEVGGRAVTAGDQLLVLSTTLDKLVLGTRPFWGGKSGPIRSTAIPYPVPSVGRWLVPMMYGREDRKTPPGATSFCSSDLVVRTREMFVIDGEFFAAPEDGRLRVETGPVFTYVCG